MQLKNVSLKYNILLPLKISQWLLMLPDISYKESRCSQLQLMYREQLDAHNLYLVRNQIKRICVLCAALYIHITGITYLTCILYLVPSCLSITLCSPWRVVAYQTFRESLLI